MLKRIRLLALAITMILVFTNTAFAEDSQLRTVHITRALWHGDPQIVPDISDNVDFIVSTEETIHGEDVSFKDKAGSVFILKADGYPDVIAFVVGGFSSGHSVGKDNVYDTGFSFRVDNPDAMVPGIPYRLVASNSSNLYKWVVEPDVTVIKGNSSGMTQTTPNQGNTQQYQAPTSSDPLQYGSDIDPNYNNAPTQLYSDVDSQHWALNAIKDLNTRHVLEGYPDGKFRPDKVVTRAEFAKIMVLAAGLTPTKVTSTSFSDIQPTDWEAPYVEAAKDFLSGYSLPSGQLIYDPEAPALREDIAVAIVKLKGYDQTRFPDRSIIQAMFKDYDSISDYAKDYVALAVDNKLVSGFPDETFRAQQPITRAQAAAMLWRAYQYGNDNKVQQETPKQTAPVKVPANPNQQPIIIIQPVPVQTPTVTDNVYGPKQ